MAEVEIVNDIGCFANFKNRVTKFFARVKRGCRLTCISGNTEAANENEIRKSSLSFLSRKSFEEELDEYIKEELRKVSQMAIEEGPTAGCAEDVKEGNDGEN